MESVIKPERNSSHKTPYINSMWIHINYIIIENTAKLSTSGHLACKSTTLIKHRSWTRQFPSEHTTHIYIYIIYILYINTYIYINIYINYITPHTGVFSKCVYIICITPVGRVRLFANYTISLSSLCRLIWRHWTTKMLVRYMLPSVCLRLRQFSQSSLIQYMGLCVFSLPISSVLIVRMCNLSYYHHQTGSMNH